NLLGKHLRVLLPIVKDNLRRFFQALLACVFKPNSMALYKFSHLTFRIMYSIHHKNDANTVILCVD
ncbi:MAG: hypothetical protein ACFE9L_03925, partial [Candidatus Hodarchaeota archaeon]